MKKRIYQILAYKKEKRESKKLQTHQSQVFTTSPAAICLNEPSVPTHVMEPFHRFASQVSGTDLLFFTSFIFYCLDVSRVWSYPLYFYWAHHMINFGMTKKVRKKIQKQMSVRLGCYFYFLHSVQWYILIFIYSKKNIIIRKILFS